MIEVQVKQYLTEWNGHGECLVVKQTHELETHFSMVHKCALSQCLCCC
jgi:hypothetical protein